jgi:hypothetical protein
MRAQHFRDSSSKASLGVALASLSLGFCVESWSAAQNGSSPSPNPPAKVPAGVILVKGAWSSDSDPTTPVPEAGTVTSRHYDSPYFHLSYPLAAGWAQQFAGPPPSDRGFYVLAQIQSADAVTGAVRGSVLIAAQDMFFTPTPANNALELVSYTGSHLRADYRVEGPPAEVTVAGRSFVRLDYFSPVTGLHWAVLATQIRCHTVQFTFTSIDPSVIQHLVAGMADMTLPIEAGVSTGKGGGDAPVCVKDYAIGGNVLNRVDPILTDRRFNSIPVRVVIDTSGKVKNVHFISSFPEQARTIGDALQQWRLKPYVLNGKAVEVETGILFGAPANRALISGRQEPQLVPARKHDPT